MSEDGERSDSAVAGMTQLDGTTPPRWRYLLVALALSLTAWGFVGIFGVTAGWTGALFHSDYTIPYMAPEGPLARAGFQAGDSVLTVEGIPVVELGMYSRWPKSLSRAPGESLTMVVERDGTRVAGEIVFGERPSGNLKLQLGGLLVGLAFLWAGVWAVFANPSIHALHLAIMGMGMGVALPGPSLGSWNGVRDHLQVAGVVLWTLMMLRFFLFFPTRKRFGTGRIATGILVGGWLLLLGCLAVELYYHPRFYHTFGPLYSLLMVAYGLPALAAFLHTMAKTSRQERRENGVSRIAVGVGVGIGGLLLWFIVALWPVISFPGSNWLPLSIAGIPIGMAMAVQKGTGLRDS